LGKKQTRAAKAAEVREVWPRGSQSFKMNTPDGWLESNGPVWWYSSDHTRGWLNPIDGGIYAGMSAVTRATSLIVNRLSSAPWEVDGSGSSRWISDPTLLRPDARLRGGVREALADLMDDLEESTLPASLRQPRSLFWAQWIRSALLWGTGWIMYIPDDWGTPRAGTMMLLNPDAVLAGDPSWGEDPGLRTIAAGDGRLAVDRDGSIEDGPFKLLELHCPTTPLNARTGMTPGVLTYHAQELGLLSAISAYSESTFTGAGVPSGYLKSEQPGLTKEAADQLKAGWMAAHGAGSRSVAVLSSAVSYQPIAVSPVDAALIDSKRLSLVDVANAFGIPGYLIGAPEGSSMTYSNVEMQLQALYEFTLRPWAVAIEETLSALLPGEQRLDIQVQGERAVISSVGPVAGAGVVPADVPEG